jgi:GNAT superfamily N-acetyltransferase
VTMSLVATGFVRSRLRLRWSRGVELGGLPPLPAILVSRLGVDVRFQSRGIGAALLWHALRVADSAALPLGVRVVVAHAVGERATGFCSRFGFRPLESDPERLYLLAQDIRASADAC